jgi:glycosyltransferase involved in cell wall biosynthesis
MPVVEPRSRDAAHSPTIGLLIRTFNRPGYLRQCIASLAQADLLGFSTRVVYDDASDSRQTLTLLDELRALGFVVQRNKVNKGQPGMVDALRFMDDVELVCCLDSDMIVKPSFLGSLHRTYLHLQETLDLQPQQLLLTGFNCTTGPFGGHPTLRVNRREGYVEKASCGGANLFYHRALHAKVKQWWARSFDWGVVEGLKANGGRIFATSPSVAQHIGAQGENSSGECDRADDF